MLRRMRWLPAAILLASLSVPIAAASAAPGDARAVVTAAGTLSPDYKLPPLATRDARALAAQERASAGERSTVGDEKLWLALDDATGELFVKEYTLRGVGEHAEVWVASDQDEISSGTRFPAGDCRNGIRTRITDAQVQYLIGQFDENIYPKEARVFSTPPDRNGQGRATRRDPGACPPTTTEAMATISPSWSTTCVTRTSTTPTTSRT